MLPDSVGCTKSEEEPLILRDQPLFANNSASDNEKGEHAIIPLRWDDKMATMTIGARQGDYAGMKREREFRIVLVDGSQADVVKQVQYTGQGLVVRFDSS